MCRRSTLVVVTSTIATSHLVAKSSQTIKLINIIAVSEVKEPIEEIVFQVRYASGHSE